MTFCWQADGGLTLCAGWLVMFISIKQLLIIQRDIHSSCCKGSSTIITSYSEKNVDLGVYVCYLVLNTLINQYFFPHQIRKSEIFPWDGNSYLTHAILPMLSREGYIHWLYWNPRIWSSSDVIIMLK